MADQQHPHQRHAVIIDPSAAASSSAAPPPLPTSSHSTSAAAHATSDQPQSPPSKRGILKNSAVGRASARLRWDEDNLMLTEAQKDSTMKITEPKTPFIHYNMETDEITGNTGAVPPMELTEALDKAKARRSSTGSLASSDSDSGRRAGGGGSDWESTDDEEKGKMNAEERQKHDKFMRLRAQHYNMRAALDRARSHTDDDDDDSDAAAPPPMPSRRPPAAKASGSSSSSSAAAARAAPRPNDVEEDDEDDDDEDGEDAMELDGDAGGK
ncbi:hypothetical protein HK405_010359 [Cladochytrium tenue]|nr:hypothetical protein HK405_010359 [Cladochytrium tenue]